MGVEFSCPTFKKFMALHSLQARSRRETLCPSVLRAHLRALLQISSPRPASIRRPRPEPAQTIRKDPVVPNEAKDGRTPVSDRGVHRDHRYFELPSRSVAGLALVVK